MINRDETGEVEYEKKSGSARAGRRPVGMAAVLVAGAVTALAVAGCAGTSTQEDASSSRTTADLDRGAQIWRATCYRCHNVRPATEFTEEQWPVLVDHMRTRAHLTRTEAESVSMFLQELAESN